MKSEQRWKGIVGDGWIAGEGFGGAEGDRRESILAMLSDSFPEPWKSFFGEINASLEEELALHCLGGFVMTVLYRLDRPTADVDILPSDQVL